MGKIVSVEVGRFDYDFAGEFKFFKPGPDGKVRRPSVLVRLTDDEGYQGWGQAVPVPTWTYETVETVETTLRYYLADAVLGCDPRDMADIHLRMNQTIRPGFTVGQPLCKAAVDLACFDLAGKQAQQPVYQLLGGRKQDAVKLNWTVASPDMAVVERQLAEGEARGFCSFNIKVGYPQTPEYDLQLVRRVKEYAPGGFLWADANTGYDLETALDMAPKLADEGVQVLESPLPPSQIRGYQQLKRQGALPITMDEGIVSSAEAAEFIALEMVDGITMKPARCAGLWPSMQIIRLLQDREMLILGSGLTDPDLSLAAALHLYTWAGITHPCALNGPQFLADTLAKNRLEPDGDLIIVPEGPGLGLELDSRAEAALTLAARLT